MVEPALTYHKHVAAGLAHTAVIDGAAVYSIGRGEIRPGALNCVRIETFPSEVLAVAAMHKSIVVLDREGQVWQGWASESACSAPLRMPSGASLHVEQLSCGLMHCLLLSSGGCVYSFGRNDEGALGRDVKGAASAEVPGAVPIRMPFTSGVLGDPNGGEPRSRVMHISAGRMHSLAVVAVPADPQEDPGTSASGGDPAVPALSLLYAWGEGMFGQMGQPQQASQYRPCLVAAEGMLDVCRVSGGAQHSLCVVKNGLAFSTGDASGGKCGIGALDGDPHTMQLVPWSRMRLPELGDDGIPEVAVDVCASRDHSVLLTAKGHAWTCGLGTHGRLGHLTDASHFVPTRVEAFVAMGLRIVEVASTSAHTVLKTQSGRIFTFGRGTEGQLGNGGVMALVEAARLTHETAATAAQLSCRGDGTGEPDLVEEDGVVSAGRLDPNGLVTTLVGSGGEGGGAPMYRSLSVEESEDEAPTEEASDPDNPEERELTRVTVLGSAAQMAQSDGTIFESEKRPLEILSTPIRRSAKLAAQSDAVGMAGAGAIEEAAVLAAPRPPVSSELTLQQPPKGTSLSAAAAAVKADAEAAEAAVESEAASPLAERVNTSSPAKPAAHKRAGKATQPVYRGCSADDSEESDSEGGVPTYRGLGAEASEREEHLDGDVAGSGSAAAGAGAALEHAEGSGEHAEGTRPAEALLGRAWSRALSDALSGFVSAQHSVLSGVVSRAWSNLLGQLPSRQRLFERMGWL